MADNRLIPSPYNNQVYEENSLDSILNPLSSKNKIQPAQSDLVNATLSPMSNDIYNNSEVDQIINPFHPKNMLNIEQPIDEEISDIEDNSDVSDNEKIKNHFKTGIANIAKQNEQLKTESKPAQKKSLQDDEMINALAKRKEDLQNAMILQGAHQVNAALANTKADENYTKGFRDIANLGPEDIKTKRESMKNKIALDLQTEGNDPNSQTSIIARSSAKDMLNKMGYKDLANKITDDVSAQQLETNLFGKVNLSNMLSQYEAQQNRLAMAQMRADTMRDKADEKKSLQVEKRIADLKNDLDPNKARGGNLAKSQAMINSAERVEALFNQFPDGNIPGNQTHELASAVAGLINAGSAQSQKQIDSLTPSSLKGDINGIASWITNNPRGLQQQKFMKMMHETTVRERQTAEDQVKKAQIQRLSAHETLKKLDPESYNNILRGYNIDPDKEVKDGKYVRPAEQNSVNNGKIKVSNGKEAFMIDKSDLAKAKAQGYNEVP